MDVEGNHIVPFERKMMAMVPHGDENAINNVITMPIVGSGAMGLKLGVIHIAMVSLLDIGTTIALALHNNSLAEK